MNEGKEVVKFNTEELELIKDTVAKDATDAELKLFLYTAAHRGLNPLTRQIHFVKRGGQGTIQTGIDGFRLIAHRTGKYVPGSKPTAFEYDSKGKLLRATVYGIKLVNGQAFEFSATAKFSEYAQYFNGKLGTMWEKMPECMLEKCAEAKMLRRGFPEELSGLYTDEEMEQATGDITVHEAEIPRPAPVESQGESEGLAKTSPESYPELANVYGDMLGHCWEHGDEWKPGPYGRYHHVPKTDENPKGICSFKEMLKPVTKKIVEAQGMDANTFNEFLKEHYGGRTWSKIEEPEQLAILSLLKREKKE